MRNEKIKKIAFAGILIALIVVMTFTNLGFIILPSSVSITLVHIPVLIGAMVLGKKYGALLGFVFGFCSFILSFFNISTNAPFTNPLVSILPRILFGFLVVPIYNLFYKLIKNDIASSLITMIVSSFLHTIIVLTMIFIVWKTGFYFGVDEFVANCGTLEGTTLFKYIYAVLISNGLIEMGLAGVVGTPIIKAIKVIASKNQIKDDVQVIEENDEHPQEK